MLKIDLHLIPEFHGVPEIIRLAGIKGSDVCPVQFCRMSACKRHGLMYVWRHTCLRFSGRANVLSVVTSSQSKSSPLLTILRMELQRSPNADLEEVLTIGIKGVASSAVWKKILLHRFPQVSLIAFAESLESGVTAIRTRIENIRL